MQKKEIMNNTDLEIFSDIFGITDENISLFDFLQKTSDIEKCFRFLYLKKNKAGNRCVCLKSKEDTFKMMKGGKRYQCVKCSKQICVTAGTIFQKTTTPLPYWFYLMYNSSISKKNISAIQASKNLNIEYKTAHRMMKSIRKSLFQVPLGKFSGVVEIDEAFIGGGTKWSRWGSICKTRKQPILGFLERKSGLIKVELIEERNIKTLDEVIGRHVEPNTTIFTDGWSGYNNLKKSYEHDFVEHSKHEYVREEVHTNSIENFWGVMKRNIRGAHTKIGHEYVQNYMDEIVWKFNHRDKTPLWRFNNLIDRAIVTTPVIGYNFKKEK